jgi:hypothetical protein
MLGMAFRPYTGRAGCSCSSFRRKSGQSAAASVLSRPRGCLVTQDSICRDRLKHTAARFRSASVGCQSSTGQGRQVGNPTISNRNPSLPPNLSVKLRQRGRTRIPWLQLSLCAQGVSGVASCRTLNVGVSRGFALRDRWRFCPPNSGESTCAMSTVVQFFSRFR